MYEQQFNTYVNEKYDNPDAVHHYEISQSSGDANTKIEVYANEALYTGDTDFYSNATIVTNREYEESEQDKKRNIRLLDPSFLDQFVDEYKNLPDLSFSVISVCIESTGINVSTNFFAFKPYFFSSKSLVLLSGVSIP